MKMKSLALICLAATGLCGTASAQTEIRLTGSTAFRAATLTAIRNILAPGFTYGYAGTSFTGSSEAIFTGTTLPSSNPPSPATPVIIKTSWGGSTGGLQTVVQNLTNTTRWLVNTTPQSTAGTPSAPANYDPPAIAHITMADTFQNSTDFKTPVLVGTRVGTIVFQWVRNNGAPITISNMTPWLAWNCLSGGTPMSLFTGNPADGATRVLATGRDEESGTRTATYADCLFGSSSNPTQYQVITDGTVVTNLIPWPATGPWPEGHSGYLGGGNLVTALNIPGSSTNPNNPAYLISYAGINDAANVNPSTPAAAGTVTITGDAVTAVNVTTAGLNYGPGTRVVFSGGGGTGAAATVTRDAAGAITGVTVTNGGSGYTSAPTVAFRGGATLTYNGVPFSATAVHEGQYTFWSYQILYHRNGYVNKPIADQLAKQIRDVDAAVSGTLLPNMKVERAVEGGDVTPL